MQLFAVQNTVLEFGVLQDAKLTFRWKTNKCSSNTLKIQLVV